VTSDEFIKEEWMTRRKIVVVAIVVVVVIIGGVGVWEYLKGSAETRAESPPDAAIKTLEPVSVQVTRPEQHTLSRQVGLPGSIEAVEQVALYAKTSGYLKWIKVDIGDRVSKGMALAEIDVPEMASELKEAEAEAQRADAGLITAQAELQRAEAEGELKQLTYERLKSIREREPDVLPQQPVDEAKAQHEVARAQVNLAKSHIRLAESGVAKAGASLARLTTLAEYAQIRAPFDGVVTKRYVDSGALIQHALSQTNVSPIVTVARVDMLRVFIDVAEPDVSSVKKGNPATLTVDALPGKVFEGPVTRFAAALDPKTRTMRTEVDIPNRDGVLRPGMYGRVNLTLEQRDGVLTVPAEALVIEAGKTYLYTVVDGRAKRVEVQTGLDDGIRVEVVNGLSGSEPVIITGKNAVSDGAPVKVSEK
jgi:RND family efflux transporter MFP subunit